MMKEPKIRFKEFKGEWEDHTLGDFGHISMCKRIFKNQTSPDGDIPFFKIGTFGYTPDAYISRKLYEEYKQQYPFPHKGDILISAAGTIGRTVEYMGEDAYYQDSNIVWLNHSNEIDNKFLKYLYSHTNWNNLEGATIKRLYNSILLSTKSNCPSLAEQQSIASFFTSIDAQISASTSRLASLKQIKAASLQAMFPQEGETVPKLRFKGFEGEWEVCVLKDIVNKLSTGKLDANAMVREGKYRFYTCGKNYFRIDRYAFDDEALLISGNGENVGYVHYYKGKFNAYQRTYVLTHFEVNVFFLKYYLIEKLPFRIKKEKSVANTPYIKMDTISEMIVMYPSNEREQKQIGEYFLNLDRQITLQSQHLEKLKQIKAACLDKMFV